MIFHSITKPKVPFIQEIALKTYITKELFSSANVVYSHVVFYINIYNMSPVRKLFVIALTCITAKLYLNKRNVFPCI